MLCIFWIYCIGIWNHKKPAFEVCSHCRVAAPAPTLWVWWLDCGLPRVPSPGRGRAAVISPAADKMCQNYFPIIQQMKLTKNIIEWPCWYIINEEGKPGPVPGLSWHKPSLRAAAVSSPPPPGHPYRTPLHNKNISLESVKILRRSVKITGPQQLSCFHISWRYSALGTGPLHSENWVGWREQRTLQNCFPL